MTTATPRTQLPAGHTIVTLENGARFVKLPGRNLLIPNQGATPYKTRKDLIENFWVWAEGTGPNGLYQYTAPTAAAL